jgi:hypothetical protein
MASPAQLAAQALSSLARVGAFVGVGATAVASAMYDGAFFLLFSLLCHQKERGLMRFRRRRVTPGKRKIKNELS